MHQKITNCERLLPAIVFQCSTLASFLLLYDQTLEVDRYNGEQLHVKGDPLLQQGHYTSQQKAVYLLQNSYFLKSLNIIPFLPDKMAFISLSSSN